MSASLRTSIIMQHPFVCESVICLVMSDSFVTPWTVVYQVSLRMEFSRQEYRSGLPFPSPGDLPNPGIKFRSPTLEADSLLSKPPGKNPTILL